MHSRGHCCCARCNAYCSASVAVFTARLFSLLSNLAAPVFGFVLKYSLAVCVQLQYDGQFETPTHAISLTNTLPKTSRSASSTSSSKSPNPSSSFPSELLLMVLNKYAYARTHFSVASSLPRSLLHASGCTFLIRSENAFRMLDDDDDVSFSMPWSLLLLRALIPSVSSGVCAFKTSAMTTDDESFSNPVSVLFRAPRKRPHDALRCCGDRLLPWSAAFWCLPFETLVSTPRRLLQRVIFVSRRIDWKNS